MGLYLPPVSNPRKVVSAPHDHFAASPDCRVTVRGDRARCSMLVAVQLSVLGLYFPPVFKGLPSDPPQTIISLPVHTAVCRSRAVGRVGGAGSRPAVGARIVSPAGV